MEKAKGLHDGHRERIIERFLKNPNDLQDHELLEILLFQYIPRKNTNDIAHRLLRAFGSLSGVFDADEAALTTVSGVGKKVAAGVILCGELIKRLKQSLNDKKSDVVFSHAQISSDFIEQLSGLHTERLLVRLMNKEKLTLTQLEFDSNSISKADIDTGRLAKAIARVNPSTVIMAHNHPSGSLKPSPEDDVATLIVYNMCFLLGVEFSDHIIVAGNRSFSYYLDGRLDNLKSKYNPNNFLKGLRKEEFYNE